MARIRSIKPDFFRDDKISKLSHEAALFFVGMWCFASDQGVITSDARALSLLMPTFRPQVIKHILRSLFREGLIGVSEDAQLVLVLGWKHQKIDKPRAGKINPSEIKWLTCVDSENPLDQSSSVRRKDRIGEDKKGKDRIDDCDGVPKEPPSRTTKALTSRKNKSPSPTSPVWEFYSEAYKDRYGVGPTRNARVNGQLSKLLQRVPQTEAPDIAKFYVQHNNPRYVASAHSISYLLLDAEKLRTEWLRGRKITQQEIKNSEFKDSLQSQLERI